MVEPKERTPLSQPVHANTNMRVVTPLLDRKNKDKVGVKMKLDLREDVRGAKEMALYTCKVLADGTV